ncbi:hypothetical protein [Streptomyces sp. ODS05-4]|uniref:hypothetical protein n=1 Tax=Streptomyces sp. ODS05-4 TaxID=2944939 RepID=UPI00210D0E46|nr:hypothetical protein [Streptomyces sp. ODS05-4]
MASSQSPSRTEERAYADDHGGPGPGSDEDGLGGAGFKALVAAVGGDVEVAAR